MECSMSKYHFTDWLIWLIATNNIFEKKTQFRRLNEIYLMDDVASSTNVTHFSPRPCFYHMGNVCLSIFDLKKVDLLYLK